MAEALAKAAANTAGKSLSEAYPATAPEAPEPSRPAPVASPPARQVEVPKLPALKGIRAIGSLKIKEGMQPITSALPSFRLERPTDLKIEEAYQRDISRKSIKLISKIAIGWDWAKFKPPVVADTKAGLFVVDGQHTAIAAASRKDIAKIPVMIVDASIVERRASAFVSHNRDRINMTPAQIFTGEVAAGDTTAKAIAKIIERAGVTIPRWPGSSESAKPGQLSAIGEVRAIFAAHGAELLDRILKIAAHSKIAPISQTLLRGLKVFLTADEFEKFRNKSDDRVAFAAGAIAEFERTVATRAAKDEVGRYVACANMIAEKLR